MNLIKTFHCLAPKKKEKKLLQIHNTLFKALKNYHWAIIFFPNPQEKRAGGLLPTVFA